MVALQGFRDYQQSYLNGERLAQDIPNAKLVRVENASHWIPQDAPDEFAREIHAFIQETQQS